MGDKLKFVSRHIPISVSIATNVPGFDVTYHAESNDPKELVKQMFMYFDQISKRSEDLMRNKMAPLIRKVEAHYNENEINTFLDTIQNYCSSIPIVGFNTSFYDINLICGYGFI